MVQMDYKCMIIHKLTQYLSRETQREELYKYATDMIHKMLRGDIFILKNLEGEMFQYLCEEIYMDNSG